jgi:hypothetical protein
MSLADSYSRISIVAHNCSIDNQTVLISPLDFIEEERRLTEINRVNAEKPQTLFTSLLGIRGRAVDGVSRATFDIPILAGKEDLIALSCPLKPFPYHLLAITIETIRIVSKVRTILNVL